jgi:hypothetical protein
MNDTLIANLSESPTAAVTPLNTVEKIHVKNIMLAEFYQRYRRISKPIVLQGLFEVVPRWNLNYLRQNLGEREYIIRYYGKGHFDVPKVEWKNYSEFRPMKFSEYADMLENGSAREERAYLAQTAVADTSLFSKVGSDLERFGKIFGFEPLVKEAQWNIWLGPSGHTEPLHFDTGEGTLIQLYGQKKVDLFPASTLKELYPFDFYDKLPPWVSRVNIDAIDYEKFPLMHTAIKQWQQVVLEEGEILFIPVGWWHEVTSLGNTYTCSLNHFWKVKPFKRNFVNRRIGLFYFLNKFPWQTVLKLDQWVRRFLIN